MSRARAASAGWAVVVAAAAAAACVDRLPDQDLRIRTAQPAAKLSADLLWKEFQADAEAARRTYFGKVVEVTGVVTTVGDDRPGQRFVLFGQDGERGVRAHLLDEGAAAVLANIPDSRRLTLRCYCEGLEGDVLLRSCIGISGHRDIGASAQGNNPSEHATADSPTPR